MTTDTSLPPALVAFLAAVGERDGLRAAEQLGEHATMYSPIFVEPVRGREAVSGVVKLLVELFDTFEIVDIMVSETRFAVLVQIHIGAEVLSAVDLITVNSAGKIASLAIHLRPLPAIVTLQNRLALAADLPVLSLTEGEKK